MEHTKDEIFEIRYHSDIPKLEFMKTNKLHRWGELFKQNKWISYTVLITIVLGIFNTVLLSNFLLLFSKL